MSFKISSIAHDISKDAKKVGDGLHEGAQEVEKGQAAEQKYLGGTPGVQSQRGQPPVETD